MRLLHHQLKLARRASRGFSLVELLLATALLMMFTGAAIISLQPADQGANLDQGAFRFASVLRFARAEAANSGRRVRVSFVQDTNQVANATNQYNQIRLTWEPKPLDEPEVFQALPCAQWGVDRVNETVGIATVRVLDPSNDFGDELAADADGPADEAPAQALPPPITFNPDGSSDTAEITLAARTPEDTRRITVRVEGLTGAVSSCPLAPAEATEDPNSREPIRPVPPIVTP